MVASLARLRVDELRKRLSARGLSTNGTKSVLVARLQKALNEEAKPAARPSGGGDDRGGRGAAEGNKNKTPPKGKEKEDWSRGGRKKMKDGRKNDKSSAKVKEARRAEENGKGREVRENGKEEVRVGGKSEQAGGEDVPKASKDVVGLSMEERMQQREERFGRKKAGVGKRERIGELEVDEEEMERRRKRAKKFGLGEKTAKEVMLEDMQRRRKAKQKQLKVPTAGPQPEKKELSEDERKMLARAARFGTAQGKAAKAAKGVKAN